jgi:8-oxo-dGTP diphosphatase
VTISETVGSSARHTDVSLWYVLHADRRLALQFDPGEFHSVHWFRSTDVPLARSDPHLQRFLTKLARRQQS